MEGNTSPLACCVLRYTEMQGGDIGDSQLVPCLTLGKGKSAGGSVPFALEESG